MVNEGRRVICCTFLLLERSLSVMANEKTVTHMDHVTSEEDPDGIHTTIRSVLRVKPFLYLLLNRSMCSCNLKFFPF